MRYYKGEPNMHVIRYRGGRVRADGPGLAFWYFQYNTSIALVPVNTQDAQFIFNETTKDFQAIAIQGNLAYRLTQPIEAAAALDFTIDLKTGHYRTKDPDKLIRRLVNVVQAHTRAHVIELALEAALTNVKDLASKILARVNDEPQLAALGVVIEALHFTSIAATPEMKKALEADYREALQQKADQAIYARRANSVEEERRIKQREMDTEVELENHEAKAEQFKLAPYGELAPQVLVGLALKEWAAAGGNIGNLTVTPDMLGQMVSWVAGARK
jgi:hypothetical protein